MTFSVRFHEELVLNIMTTYLFHGNQVFFSKFYIKINQLNIKDFGQRGGFTPGYPDHFPTGITITPQNQ